MSLNQTVFAIPEQLHPHCVVAIMRLEYLHPNLTFEFLKSEIRVSTNLVLDEKTISELKTDIFYQVYREKIYAETLPIKTWLFQDE